MTTSPPTAGCALQIRRISRGSDCHFRPASALRKHARNYGPIMVHQLFPSALNAPLEAIRVAQFQLVTSECLAVTAEAAGSSPMCLQFSPAISRQASSHLVLSDLERRHHCNEEFIAAGCHLCRNPVEPIALSRKSFLRERSQLCRNCVKTPPIRALGALLERKADSPSYCFC
jgi:hypothetical protein